MRLNLLRIMRCSIFFQAEDGIRFYKVTGVQTCALPICPVVAADEHLQPGRRGPARRGARAGGARRRRRLGARGTVRRRDRMGIGRASCRERGEWLVIEKLLYKNER